MYLVSCRCTVAPASGSPLLASKTLPLMDCEKEQMLKPVTTISNTSLLQQLAVVAIINLFIFRIDCNISPKLPVKEYPPDYYQFGNNLITIT